MLIAGVSVLSLGATKAAASTANEYNLFQDYSSAAPSLVVSVPAPEQPVDPTINPDDRVGLLADMLEHDETGQIVTARGNVELNQAGRRLRADQMSYNLSNDVVLASGNVVLQDPTGDTYLADNFELSQQLKEGFVVGLRGLLADGSRFNAVRGQQAQGGAKLILEKADYTPCEPCKNNPDKVLWQLKAETVTHHKDEQRISYENARFELGGVPILYTPYFSHPDGSVERKSGFLTPTVGFDSELGASYKQEYYWDIAPNRDATIGLRALTEEAPVLSGQYRHRFDDARFEADGSITYSSRFDLDDDGTGSDQDEDFRGHLFSESLWEINDKWRAGLDVELTSDDQYLRQYDITTKDVLENNLYLERLSNRNYGLARLTAFQDVRTSDRQEDQPNVLPEIYSRFLGAPGQTLGGRWYLDASALGLHREGNDQDLSRGTLEAGWDRRYVAGFGLVSTTTLMARGDTYYVNDRNIADTNATADRDSSEVRGFVKGNFKTSYPIARNYEKLQWMIEPMASLTLGTNVDNDDNIPNEDSQDVFIDPLTLFELNRFPGYDVVEDKSHATYGIRTGLFGYNGYRGELFLGQSYRFNRDDNPFPTGSGFSEDASDYIGQLSSSLGSNLTLDYRFQFDEDDYNSKRHEVDFTGNLGPVTASTRYFYASALEGTDLNEDREQIRSGLRLKLDDQWSVFGSAQYDFDEDDEGFRRATSGFLFEGQCLTFGITGQKTFTRDTSGDSDTTIMARIGLKNLGEFQTSAFSIGSSDDTDDSSDDDETDAVEEAINE
ncbi:MAG: LPS assembly protein LptD [Pseudomonadota bacterium]